MGVSVAGRRGTGRARCDVAHQHRGAEDRRWQSMCEGYAVTDTDRRSLVRIKLWALFGVFLACWLAVRFGWVKGQHALLVMPVAMLAVGLTFFVRCEQCHEPMIRIASTLNPKSTINLFFPAKRCPKCGKERV